MKFTDANLLALRGARRKRTPRYKNPSMPWWVDQSKRAGDFYITRVTSSLKNLGTVHKQRQSKNDLVVRVDRNLVLPDYLFYVLMHLQPELACRGRGSAQKFITAGDVHDVLRAHFTKRYKRNPYRGKDAKHWWKRYDDAVYHLARCINDRDAVEAALEEVRHVSKWRKGDIEDTERDLQAARADIRELSQTLKDRDVADKIAMKDRLRGSPNPTILSITNPASREMTKAIAAYRKFHGVDPIRTTIRGRKGKRPRKILIVLGRLVDLVYEPSRGERKRIHWIHAFGRNARLAVDPTGKHLYIIAKEGMRQVDFSRGIIS